MRKNNAGALRHLPHIANRLFDVPLMMHPRKLRAIVGVIGMEMGIAAALQPDIMASVDDDFLTTHTHACVPPGCGISVIPIHGTLVQRGDSLDAMSGLRSYDSIRADLRDALADASTDAILLDIDSGGGEVAGCFDLVDEIAAAGKPVYAFADEHAYSAAYALACAADKIFVARTGGVGSIGIVGVHCDQSGFDKDKGLSYTPIYAGARKIDGWPHAPLSDEAKAEFQRSVDRNYGIFVESVAVNRGLSEKAVRDTQAGSFTPDEALKLGLVDGVFGFDEVVEMIAQDLQSRTAPQGFSGQGGRKARSGSAGGIETGVPENMTRTVLKGAAAGADASDKQEPAAGAAAEDTKPQDGEEPDDTENDDDGDETTNKDQQANAAAAAAAKPAITSAQDAADIADFCMMYGKPALASGFIRSGMSAQAVRDHLLKQRNEEAKAETVASQAVNTAQTTTHAVENALLADMKSRVSKK